MRQNLRRRAGHGGAFGSIAGQSGKSAGQSRRVGDLPHGVPREKRGKHAAKVLGVRTDQNGAVSLDGFEEVLSAPTGEAFADNGEFGVAIKCGQKSEAVHHEALVVLRRFFPRESSGPESSGCGESDDFAGTLGVARSHDQPHFRPEAAGSGESLHDESLFSGVGAGRKDEGPDLCVNANVLFRIAGKGVELHVAADHNLAGAESAKAAGILLALRKNSFGNAEKIRGQRAEPSILAQVSRGHAAVDYEDGNIARARFAEMVGPKFRLRQNHARWLQTVVSAAHGGWGVERKPADDFSVPHPVQRQGVPVLGPRSDKDASSSRCLPPLVDESSCDKHFPGAAGMNPQIAPGADRRDAPGEFAKSAVDRRGYARQRACTAHRRGVNLPRHALPGRRAIAALAFRVLVLHGVRGYCLAFRPPTSVAGFMRDLISFFRGDWPKWFLIGLWGPVMSVLVAALFAASANRFPGGYDWRFDVMCRLGYPHANPDGSVYWAAALALTCIMGVPCCGYFHRRLARTAPKLAAAARLLLGAGLSLGMVIGLDGIFLPKLNEMAPKLHETVATAAFAAIFFGVLGFWSVMTRWLRAARHWSAAACTLLSLSVLVPMAGAMISQAYLFFAPGDLGWVGPDWAEKGVPVYLSFAFWEWLAIGGVYFCLYVMAVLLPARPEDAGNG